MKKLFDLLKECKKEEEVKSEFLKEFKASINALNLIDHYTPEILFDFKYNKDFKKRHNVARAIAQTMYYVRRLMYSTHIDFVDKPVPPIICIVDKNEGFFIQTSDYKEYFQGRKAEKYDWDRAPSTPCPLLIADIEEGKPICDVVVYDFSLDTDEMAFRQHYERYSFKSSFDLLIKKSITEDNFWAIFRDWNKKFGKRVQNGHSAAEYFLSDIEEGNTRQMDDERYFFKIGDNYREKRLPGKIYRMFWDSYDKIPHDRMLLIRQRKAILAEDFDRRMRGEYYTPVDFAEKSLEYLSSILGKEWWKSGEYRIWDMAAGTGNLELKLPTSALQYCYLSTIESDDVEYLKKIFPRSTVFQYDYLNDDVAQLSGTLIPVPTKMPSSLVNDLNNDKIKWIILLNPPYKTTNNNEAKTWMKTWDGVSKTTIREWMASEGLLETSRELYMQFIFRLTKEFRKKDALLCLYSTLKYITSNNDQKARDKFIHWSYKKGYIFNVKCFYRAKGDFPVSFAIWDIGKSLPINKQNIIFDVFDEKVNKIGFKQIKPRDRKEMLNKWCPRHRNSTFFVPFSSAFLVATKDHTDVRNRIANGFICSFSSQSDALYEQNFWNLLSTPHVSAGAFSVIPENFEKAMVMYAVKRIPKPTWTNNRDHFYAPSIRVLPDDFISDCVVYSSFEDNNQTVALKDVEWDGRIWQVENHMFPFLLKEIRKWNISSEYMRHQIYSANEDRFLATWISSHNLSPESSMVMTAARALYQAVYSQFNDTYWNDAQMETWDFGLAQIKKAIKNTDVAQSELKVLKEVHKKLRDKLLQKIYEYGFMDEDVTYYDSEE